VQPLEKMLGLEKPDVSGDLALDLELSGRV
jgi:hypothetical protein